VIESPRVVLQRHGLSARKSWGQNFLHAMEVHRAIVQAAGAASGVRTVEIGAGLGTLTAHLLAAGSEVWAIERDRDLCRVLREEFAGAAGLTLFEVDAVSFDYASASDARHPRPAIVGNLPYHLTGPLLFTLLRYDDETGPWVVMVQKEVADRLCAPVGTKAYGGITVGLSRVRSISRVVSVPPGAFMPPPRVDSAVIRLEPRTKPRGEVADSNAFLELVRTAFQMRRKTLGNALSRLGSKAEVASWCRHAGVDPRLRPERLTPEDFAALQRAREDA
jgi:16S rRNA (adenine1518-N6/adenine1519-N6)-dimethyltransferase